jgi:negative regulator of replication initiation
MTITVEIRPEVQAELARQAASHGRAIEAYAASLLEEAVDLPAETLTNADKRKREKRKSLVEVCAMVRGLTDDVDFSRSPSTDRPVDLS